MHFFEELEPFLEKSSLFLEKVLFFPIDNHVLKENELKLP
jgi:hypothetical protein